MIGALPLDQDQTAEQLQQQTAQLLAHLETLHARLRFTAPGVDCYVRGCTCPPYLATRSKRRGLVLTCEHHDPHRFGDGADFDEYAWILRLAQERAKTAQDARQEEEAAKAAHQKESNADVALRLLQGLIQLAQGGSLDQDSNQGGTREPRRPVPPVLPSGGRHADDPF